MYKLNDVNFLNFYVDMSDQDQGPPIDPSKMIGGRRAMTHSHRRERQNAHIPKRGRGKGRADGSGTSHASENSQPTHPEESQVVDPTHEYLNYQDHYDVTDGRLDEQYMPEKQHIPDDDDIAAAVALEVLPVDPPFPGGLENLSLLHSYARHVALPLWYNSDNVSVIFLSFTCVMS